MTKFQIITDNKNSSFSSNRAYVTADDFLIPDNNR